MPGFTDVWSNNVPDGSEDADELETYIQNLRLAINERMDDILGTDGDWTADPIIPSGYDLTALKTAITAAGSQTGIQRTLGWYAGQVHTTVGTITQSAASIIATGVSGEFNIIIPVVLPVGVTITQARARVFYNDAGHTFEGTFVGYTDTNLNYTQTLSTPSASVNPQWMTAASLTHVTIANQHYAFVLRADNNNVSTATELRLHSVQVTYTHPGGAIR